MSGSDIGGRALRIAVVHTAPRVRERFVEALRARLPAAEVIDWTGATDGQGDADYAVGWAPPADFFGRHPRLRAFFSAAAGVDHLLEHPALPPELPIVRLEDAGMAQQMLEYCLCELLRLTLRRDDYAQRQAEARWEVLLPEKRSRWPVGVLGLGALGAEVAQGIARFGYPVVGYSRKLKSIEGVRCFSEAAGDGAGADDGLDAFLAATRVLIVMAPLTAQTRDLLDARRLARLQPGGYVINVARGPLVVDADLVSEIDRGHLAGATLDVFREEPLPAQHPFWRHPAIRITPHVAALTLVGPSALQIADKLERMDRGEAVSGWVDRARGY